MSAPPSEKRTPNTAVVSAWCVICGHLARLFDDFTPELAATKRMLLGAGTCERMAPASFGPFPVPLSSRGEGGNRQPRANIHKSGLGFGSTIRIEQIFHELRCINEAAAGPPRVYHARLHI
jgi:hypothetical protein